MNEEKEETKEEDIKNLSKDKFFDMLEDVKNLEKECYAIDDLINRSKDLAELLGEQFEFPDWVNVNLPGSMRIKNGGLVFNVNINKEIAKQTDHRLQKNNFHYCSNLEYMLRLLHLLRHFDEFADRIEELYNDFKYSRKTMEEKLNTLAEKINVLKSVEEEEKDE